jgi:hypothetical protein
MGRRGAGRVSPAGSGGTLGAGRLA